MPDDGFHRGVRSPEIPELDQPVLAARGQAEGLVRIVVQVSNRETVRFRHRSSCSAAVSSSGERCVGRRVGTGRGWMGQRCPLAGELHVHTYAPQDVVAKTFIACVPESVHVGHTAPRASTALLCFSPRIYDRVSFVPGTYLFSNKRLWCMYVRTLCLGNC